MWNDKGRELFYLDDDNRIVSVPVEINGTSDSPVLSAGAPEVLFSTALTSRGFRDYAVARDGERFLAFPNADEVRAPTIGMIVNWPGLLARN